MKLIPVDFDPRELRVDTRHRPSGELIEFFTAFIESGKKFAKVEYEANEYTHPQSGYISMAERIRKDRLPIQVVMRNGEIYLVRSDA